MKTNEQSDTKDVKQFWNKIWDQKEHNRKAKWINNTKKKLQELEEDPGIIQNNTQKYRFGKRQTMMVWQYPDGRLSVQWESRYFFLHPAEWAFHKLNKK